MPQHVNSELNEDITKRLEKLNQWQDEQTKILSERQSMQIKILGFEHRKMYERLGLMQSPETVRNSDEDFKKANQLLVNSSMKHNYLNECETILIQKKPFLKRGQGIKSRFKIDPNSLRLDNLPRYKYANTHRNLSLLKETKPQINLIEETSENEKQTGAEAIDLHEIQFQELLISSKTVCNSTPQFKNIQQSQSKITQKNLNQVLSTHNSNEKKIIEPISWAKVLDPKNVVPIDVQSFRNTSASESFDKSDNLSIFELIEQKAAEGSIDFQSSYIKRFLNAQDTEKSFNCELVPVDKTKVPQNLSPSPPKVLQNQNFLSSSDYDDDDEIDKEDTLKRRKAKVHVHFADETDTQGIEDSKTTIAEESYTLDILQQLKEFLIKAQNANQSDREVFNSFKLPQDILEKTDLVKQRLVELEDEINRFKQNNLELIKSKQEHELDKVHLIQERQELMEKINDERIQIEIYLHDERIKLEDEKRNFEKQISMQKSSAISRDRREIIKLKEEIENLQKELKNKEQTHVAAQSRLRAQIRTLEKDQKALCNDIDSLKKENKKLQDENIKISRENNNKMLNEINRNIAKLAPKLQPPIRQVEDNTKAKDIPVTSLMAARKPKMKSKKLADKLYESKHSTLVSSELSSDSRSSDSEYSLRNTSKDKSTIKIQHVKDSSNEFKREIMNTDGSKDILYPNGNLKKISSDGMIIRMLYFNKDIKETNINEGTVKYYYAATNTWHTSYLDGLEILEFPNGQTEHRYKNGIVEVHFPNNSVKITNPADGNKLEDWRFADGTNLINMRNGDKILILPNGQKEIHTAQSKRREYPDGTVKHVYPDGSQETRYSNGRVRLKDKDGNLVMDTDNSKY